MRSKLLIAVTLLATMISPAVTVAEPDTLAKKNVADNIVVDNVQETMTSKVGMTQVEMAQVQIDENLKKIEELKNAEAAKAEADRVAAVAAAAQKAAAAAVYVAPRAIKTNASNADAVAYGRARNAEVFGEAQWPALFELWSRESGWKDTAINYSSGACGIPQFISGCVVGDHVSQIDRGLIYIQKRYGTPAKAIAFHNAHNWY